MKPQPNLIKIAEIKDAILGLENSKIPMHGRIMYVNTPYGVVCLESGEKPTGNEEAINWIKKQI